MPDHAQPRRTGQAAPCESRVITLLAELHLEKSCYKHTIADCIALGNSQSMEVAMQMTSQTRCRHNAQQRRKNDP
jgi:hypothetical protein